MVPVDRSADADTPPALPVVEAAAVVADSLARALAVEAWAERDRLQAGHSQSDNEQVSSRYVSSSQRDSSRQGGRNLQKPIRPL